MNICVIYSKKIYFLSVHINKFAEGKCQRAHLPVLLDSFVFEKCELTHLQMASMWPTMFNQPNSVYSISYYIIIYSRKNVYFFFILYYFLFKKMFIYFQMIVYVFCVLMKYFFSLLEEELSQLARGYRFIDLQQILYLVVFNILDQKAS